MRKAPPLKKSNFLTKRGDRALLHFLTSIRNMLVGCRRRDWRIAVVVNLGWPAKLFQNPLHLHVKIHVMLALLSEFLAVNPLD